MNTLDSFFYLILSTRQYIPSAATNVASDAQIKTLKMKSPEHWNIFAKVVEAYQLYQSV